MSLSAGDQAQIIGVGVAGVLAFGAGVWRAGSLRGDINARWAARVDFAVAALDAKTIQMLQALRDEVGEVLPKERTSDDPESPDTFDPSQAIADPAPLSERAAQAVNLHRTRTRMESAISGLMRIGRATVGGLAGMLVGTACTTAHYAELWTWKPLEVAGLGLLAASTLVLLAVATIYLMLLDRLATAEALAGTAGQAEQTST
jgi:hypothetical protein